MESLDLIKFTKKQLITICKERGIKRYSNKSNQKLIHLIKNNDVSCKKTQMPKKDVKIEPVVKIEMTSEVLTLCNLPNSLNVEKLKDSVAVYMHSRESYYREKNRAPFIEDEFGEFYISKVTNGVEIGAGSCAMDVKTGENEGIDVMCVIMNTYTSNEKSLIQNFSSSGENLDTLFKERKDEEALKLFINDYSKKLQDVKREKNLTDLYILSFVSTTKEVYVVCFKINLENMEHVSSGGFINKQKDSCVNIIVSNFINPSHGNVKLYKSKKRMELRLSASVLKTEYAIKLYSMS